MTVSKNVMTQLLGYSGLLPFIAITLAVVAGVAGADELFILYSLSILAFMAGGAWGAIQQADHDRFNEQGANSECNHSSGLEWAILAYLIALLGVLLPMLASLVLLVVAFVMVILLEQKQALFEGYSQAYRGMRWVLTTVVILCHLTIIVSLL